MTPDRPQQVTDPSEPPEVAEPGPYDGGALGAGIDWSDPNSRLAPLYLTAGGVAAVVVLALAFLLLATVPLWHTDFWVHLKYGEWIAANGRLPDREPLSPFTDKQTPMFDAMWLSQVGYHVLFRAGSAAAGGDGWRGFEGGVEAVRLAHLFAAVAAVGLFGLAYRRACDSVPWAVGGMVFLISPVVGILGPLETQRPQTFALVFFAALLCGLSRPVLTRRAVVWIPLLIVLWANVHGSFPVGLVMLGIFLVGRVFEVVRGSGWRAVWADAAVRRLAAALVLAATAAAFLNPYGPKMYLEVARFGDNPNVKTMGEWQPLDFSEGRRHWGYMTTLLLLAVTLVVSPRAVSPAQFLLIVSFGVWPLFQQRMYAWWDPLVPWLIAPHWVAVAARWGLEAPANTPSLKKTFVAAVVAFAAVVASSATNWLKAGRPRPVERAVHRATPYDVAAALKGDRPTDPNRVAALSAALRSRPDVAAVAGGRAAVALAATGPADPARFAGRVFASETLGEYLLWALPPEAPVMLCNHAQLFPAEYWTELALVKAGAPGWWDVLDRYRAEVVVVEADGYPNLCTQLRAHPGWAVVLDEADKPAGLFVAVRRSAEARP